MERKTSELDSIWVLKELEREMEVARGSGSAEVQRLEEVEEVDAFIPSSRKQKVGEKWHSCYSLLSSVFGHRRSCTFLSWWSILVCCVEGVPIPCSV